MNVLKETHFHRLPADGWPNPARLRPFFFDPSLQDWGVAWGLNATNVDPKELAGWDQPTDLRLTMAGSQFHGVFFQYRRFGAGRGQTYYAKGDLRRMREWVEIGQGDLYPVGLFVPFEAAWRAVKEFIERNGALPECIEWVDRGDLPHGTFPRWGFEGDERVWVTGR
jgi:Immunity protein Imm1